jgi:hypothetical protein
MSVLRRLRWVLLLSRLRLGRRELRLGRRKLRLGRRKLRLGRRKLRLRLGQGGRLLRNGRLRLLPRRGCRNPLRGVVLFFLCILASALGQNKLAFETQLAQLVGKSAL